MENCKMKCWGHREADAFEGLMPKVMEVVGADNCIGACDEVVSSFDPALASDSLNVAADALEVVSPDNIMEK